MMIVHSKRFALLACSLLLPFWAIGNGMSVGVCRPVNSAKLLPAEVSRIWSELETQCACTVMATMERGRFRSTMRDLGLDETGNGLRYDEGMRGALKSHAQLGYLLFSKVRKWGGVYSMSVELVKLSDFSIRRATMEHDKEVTSVDVLISRVPDLLDELGLDVKPDGSGEKLGFRELILLGNEAADNKFSTDFLTCLRDAFLRGGYRCELSGEGKKGAYELTLRSFSVELTREELNLPVQMRSVMLKDGRLALTATLKNLASLDSRSISVTRDFDFSVDSERVSTGGHGDGEYRRHMMVRVSSELVKQVLNSLP